MGNGVESVEGAGGCFLREGKRRTRCCWCHELIWGHCDEKPTMEPTCHIKALGMCSTTFLHFHQLQECTAVFRLVVQKSQGESAHVRGDFELKILRMRGFSSRFLDNQPENCCMQNQLGCCLKPSNV